MWVCVCVCAWCGGRAPPAPHSWAHVVLFTRDDRFIFSDGHLNVSGYLVSGIYLGYCLVRTYEFWTGRVGDGMGKGGALGTLGYLAKVDQRERHSLYYPT